MPGTSYGAFDVAIDPANPSQIYSAITRDNVFRSTDGGATWTPVCFTNDSPCSFRLEAQFRQSIAVGPPAPGAPNACSGGTKPCGVVYAMVGAGDGIEYLGFFRSIDGGATWTAESVPQFTNSNHTIIDGTSPTDFSQSFYDQTLLVDPLDPSIVFFGGVGLYKSADSGATWSFLPANGGTHSDQHALAIAPDNDTVYVGNDGGAYKFAISGISGGVATFTALNDTLPVGQIQGIGPHPTSNSSLIAGFQDNGTDLYNGTSATPLAWNQTDTGDGGFALFDQVNPAFAYHTYASIGGFGSCAGITIPALATSSDSAQHWNFSGPMSAICTAMAGAADTGANFYPPLATDPSVAERVLVGAEHIYVSDDGMMTWSEETTQNLTGGCGDGECALQDIEFAPSDDTKAWALSIAEPGVIPFKLFNTIKANVDTGVTWTDLTANLPFSSASTQATGIAPDPNNSGDAYLSISGFTASTGVGHVFRTTDFGATWVEADGATTNAGNSSCSSFTALPDIPVLRVLVDRQDSSGNTIYAATDIGVFKSTDGGCTWAPFDLGVLPAVPVFDIEQNLGGAIFIGTHGRGAYQLIR